MKQHEVSEKLTLEFLERDMNEADTRHQIIDPLLHDVFGWPRTRVRCEQYIKPGYADYILERTDGEPILVIEAKREGDYFHLPPTTSGKSLGNYIKVKTLLTDPGINAAATQARSYCLEIGCDRAAITNGHEWIFFTTFQKGTNWKEARAFVVAGLSYFSDKFTEAFNHFSYQAIVENGSLRRLLLDGTLSNRELYYPKLRVPSYDAPVDSNRFASSLRPIIDKYFGVIDPADSIFMDSCYVNEREYDIAHRNALHRLEDAITPYLKEFNVQDFRDADTGGGFANRLSKPVTAGRSSDVVVLFGGKGVGKSTFLWKLLFHKPPQILKKNAVIATIDLLTTPPEVDLVRVSIWTKLVNEIDLDRVLSGDRDGLCELFSDRFSQAEKQDLFGLAKDSSAFNLTLNGLVATWKNDIKYVATRLAGYWRARHKVIIAVVDNTDQYKREIQENCFSIAQEISATLNCLTVISMREERFYASSIHGVLDAFQNSGFHITSPEPAQVFLKRIRYVQHLLRESESAVATSIPDRVDRETVLKLLRIFQNEFDNPNSHLANFLTACTHGNIRLALELFRGFVVSGYTNVHEMTAIPGWILQVHQVIKPFMIPSRFFYEEQYSLIPNILQIRSKSNGSHFTSLRILSSLYKNFDAHNPPLLPVAKLAADFSEIYGMPEDFEMNMAVLLKHGLIEANNRLEEFDSDVDSVKITAYGEFMANVLCREFTYIELVCIDCAISDQSVSNDLAELSNDDYRLYVDRQRIERVEKRIAKADIFLNYLAVEEQREIDLFKTHDLLRFVQPMRAAFDLEKLAVRRSAKRVKKI